MLVHVSKSLCLFPIFQNTRKRGVAQDFCTLLYFPVTFGLCGGDDKMVEKTNIPVRRSPSVDYKRHSGCGGNHINLSFTQCKGLPVNADLPEGEGLTEKQ